jgi:1,4-dihydroxy-2-naphthoate octaprenyltransferase
MQDYPNKNAVSVPKQEHVPFLKKWIIAARPWALPASTMPLIYGTSLGTVFGSVPLDVIGLILALVSMIFHHSTANIVSDIFDFKRGLDTEITPVSGAIVRGWITTRQAAIGAVVFSSIGLLLGIVLILRTGILLLIIGLAGIVISLIYPYLKYHALGDLAVFFNFGILGSLGAWVIQTHSLSWLPVIWAVPMSMLVCAILHANNWRDTATDKKMNITTVAGMLGDQGSLLYYGFLVFGSFVVVLFLLILPRIIHIGIRPMPWPFLITLLAIPTAMKLWHRAINRHTPKQPMDFIILDGTTAQYNIVFGMLCTAAAWIHSALNLVVTALK